MLTNFEHVNVLVILLVTYTINSIKQNSSQEHYHHKIFYIVNVK